MSSNGTDPTATSAPEPTSPAPSPTPASTPLTEPSSPAPGPSTEPTSTPVSLPPTSSPEPSSSPPPAPSTSTPEPSPTPSSSEAPPPPTTSTVTASSAPPSTQVITSVVTPTETTPGQTAEPTTIVVTLTPSDAKTDSSNRPTSTSTSSSTSAPAGLQNNGASKSSGGLSTGGKTAIAVVVPVVVVALLVLAGIILWRRRKQRKTAEEDRRKEVEEYGFNPNNDPTLPAVAMGSEMAEDQSGYRGWGNATTSSNHKASTTLTSGMTYSDSNSNPGGYQSPGSPTAAYSDSQSNDALMNGRRETLDSEGIAALGAAPNANQNQSSVHRGPSNASSSYSAANRSDTSGDYPIPVNNPQDYYDNNGYYQASPYGDAYGGGQQPIIRDVSARRNTRIESPSVFPQQGNSGIAQNF